MEPVKSKAALMDENAALRRQVRELTAIGNMTKAQELKLESLIIRASTAHRDAAAAAAALNSFCEMTYGVTPHEANAHGILKNVYQADGPGAQGMPAENFHVQMIVATQLASRTKDQRDEE